MAAIVVLMHAGMSVYENVMRCYEDEVVGNAVAEILGLLDYMDVVDALDIPLPIPPRMRRQHATTWNPVEVVDLTGDDVDDIPVAASLDFTLIVDELDNGGLFQAQPQR